MASGWAPLHYEDWAETCDTLHAHTQILGKLCIALAPPEPQLQHAALRLTARGWETNPLPAPDGEGTIVAGLDLRRHEAFVEQSAGSGTQDRTGLIDQPVAGIADFLLSTSGVRRAGARIDLRPQEVPWTVPLDEDDEHRCYDPEAVGRYFAAATRAALVLAAFRAPYRGRCTPVNAWWGSFDLAVNLFSGAAAEPPAGDFIMRNAMDAQEIAVGWWPGDPRYGRAAFYAYAHPAPEDFAEGALDPSAARWAPELGEFVLDWDDVCASGDPHGAGLAFARSAFAHACERCGWDPALPASAAGSPPPVR